MNADRECGCGWDYESMRRRIFFEKPIVKWT